MLTLIRTVYLNNWPYIIKADYPDQCPTCGQPLDGHAYGIHLPEWDEETVTQILEGTEVGKMVSIQGVMDCDEGHPVTGTLTLRKSTETDDENNVEYQCVAQTFARSHQAVEALLAETPFARAAPGVFVPQGSHVETTEGFSPPVVIGHSCQIAESATVGPMVLLHESKLNPEVYVAHSVVIESEIEGPQEVRHTVVLRTTLSPDSDKD